LNQPGLWKLDLSRILEGKLEDSQSNLMACLKKRDLVDGASSIPGNAHAFCRLKVACQEEHCDQFESVFPRDARALPQLESNL
jgi:hypothetical protein